MFGAFFCLLGWGQEGTIGQRLWPLSLSPTVTSTYDRGAFFLVSLLSFQGWSSAGLTVALPLCPDSARLRPWGLLDLSTDSWPSAPRSSYHLLQELVLSLARVRLFWTIKSLMSQREEQSVGSKGNRELYSGPRTDARGGLPNSVRTQTRSYHEQHHGQTPLAAASALA